MGRLLLPRHFILSVLLLLTLISIYVVFEATRFKDELFRQTDAKGAALVDAVDANIRAAVLANSLLDELLEQRLLDNARLIDELLQFPRTDENTLKQVAAANRLSKIELLDANGRRLESMPTPGGRHRQEMIARMKNLPPEELQEQRRAMMPFMWGRRWRLPDQKAPPPPKIAEKKFWEGSVFGVAIGARSFPGIIAIHAQADYIVHFRKQIDVQRQVEEIGRQPDIGYAAFFDNDFKVLAHTNPEFVKQRGEISFLTGVQAGRGLARRIVENADGTRHLAIARTVSVNGSPIGVLEIGLSLSPNDTTWRRSLRSTAVLGSGILVVGILGLAVIFYNQRGHLRKVRTLEEEINRKERLSALGDMAATVAHEIRNPLNSVSMGMQRLKAEFTPTENREEYARFLQLMQDEVLRLNATVEQFLSLARPLELHREEIRIDDIVREVVSLFAAEAKAAGVELRVDVAADLPPLRADRNLLKQLLLNLLLNGAQAMPGGGALTVEAVQEDKLIRLSIIDRGVGIEPARLEKVFDPYFTTKAKGSGLGLAIARRIAEAHGGKISAASEAGRGAVFHLRLPLRANESE